MGDLFSGVNNRDELGMSTLRDEQSRDLVAQIWRSGTSGGDCSDEGSLLGAPGDCEVAG